MGWLFENFQILLIIGLALAAWLKNRSESKQEEEAERRAREQMVQGMKEAKQRTQVNRPDSNAWDTRPQSPATQPSSPAPGPAVQPPPITAKAKSNEEPDHWERTKNAHQAKQARKAEPAPWESFVHQDADKTEIRGQGEEPLNRQRDMQERIAQLKRTAKEFKTELGGARATQRQVEHRGREEHVALPKLASALKDPCQTRRAIVLREILGPPIGMRR